MFDLIEAVILRIESALRLAVQTAIVAFVQWFWLADVAIKARAGDYLNAGYSGIGLLGITATFLAITSWGAPAPSALPRLKATRAWAYRQMARSAHGGPGTRIAPSNRAFARARQASHFQ